MKLGLALGGGGARGYSHLGIVQALHDLGIPIYCIAGTSIGAIIGGAVAAGVEQKAVDWINQPDWRKLPGLFFDIRIPWRGLIRGNKIDSFFREIIPSGSFNDLKMPFATVATDYNSGEEVVMSSGDVHTAIRASMSIPGVFNPVEYEGRVLVDGGLSNPVPVDVCRRLGAEKVIAVDINAGHLITARRAISDVNVFDAVDTMFTICCNRIAMAKASVHPPDLLLCPKLRDIMMLDFRCGRELMVQGYEYAMLKRNEIRRLVES